MREERKLHGDVVGNRNMLLNNNPQFFNKYQGPKSTQQVIFFANNRKNITGQSHPDPCGDFAQTCKCLKSGLDEFKINFCLYFRFLQSSALLMTMRIVPIHFSHDYDEQNKFKMRQSHHVLRNRSKT